MAGMEIPALLVSRRFLRRRRCVVALRLFLHRRHHLASPAPSASSPETASSSSPSSSIAVGSHRRGARTSSGGIFFPDNVSCFVQKRATPQHVSGFRAEVAGAAGGVRFPSELPDSMHPCLLLRPIVHETESGFFCLCRCETFGVRRRPPVPQKLFGGPPVQAADESVAQHLSCCSPVGIRGGECPDEQLPTTAVPGEQGLVGQLGGHLEVRSGLVRGGGGQKPGLVAGFHCVEGERGEIMNLAC